VDGVTVAGWDPDRRALERALAKRAVDEACESVAEAVRGAEVCFVCAPVGQVAATARAALDCGGDCVVSDVGSVKAPVLEGLADSDVERFVGGHPLAGAEASGVEHARAELFEGATWYLTPTERSSGVLYERLYRTVASLGAKPAAIPADIHDRLMATVSHLPHVLANVLVSQAARTVDREDEPLPRVGPSFRDATRVAGANSDIWTDIYVQNAAAIADEVDATIDRLREIATALRTGDADAVRAWNDGARDHRRRLLEADIAGGPVHELRVTVDNRPGVVAELAVALGRGGVNIVDMRLAPAPDNLTGAITFWIAGDESAQRAAQLIEGLGFPVMEQG
jgi:prephenate dehydrogenase